MAQTILIKKLLFENGSDDSLKKVKVVTVDNY